MGTVIAFVVIVIAAFLLGFRLGCWHERRTRARWLVRPHTRRTLREYPLPEEGSPTVSEAAFVRTNMPNSTSTMD